MAMQTAGQDVKEHVSLWCSRKSKDLQTLQIMTTRKPVSGCMATLESYGMANQFPTWYNVTQAMSV